MSDLNHKEWLNNEYRLWVDALKTSTVENFGENLMVKRMLGDVSPYQFYEMLGFISEDAWIHIYKIQTLGGDFKGIVARMVYYAQKVLKQNPTSICEIGGGVGQFYAVLRALGYKGTYYIFDLKDVREFQRKYLDEVEKRTGLNTQIDFLTEFDYCVAMYSWGEFDDELKDWYLQNVIKKCPHGLILFNPHSGASDKIDFDCKIEPEYPLTSPGNKLITW